MAYAILRTEKHKSKATIAASSRHTFREQDTPNARDDGKVITLIGTGDIAADVQRRIDTTGATYKKDSVLSVEFLLSASPEFFRPDDPCRYGHFDPKTTKEWIKHNARWMRQKYGDNLVSLVVHLDEATPHVTAHVVPIDPESNRLNAKGMVTGGRKMLADLQTDYAKGMEKFGLERGKEKSQATHQDIKSWYAEQAKIHAPVKVPKVAVATPPMLGREQWAQDLRQELQRTVARTMYEAARKAKDAQQRATKAEAKAKKASAAAAKADAASRIYKAQADQLRALPLSDVLEALGCQRDKYDKQKYLTPAGPISVETNGQRFQNWVLEKGGRGAIDLTMMILDCDYQSAIQELALHFGSDAAAAIAARAAYEAAHQVADKPKSFAPPIPCKDQWSKVREYLTAIRRLPAKLIDWLADRGQIYADRYANVVMLYSDGKHSTGAELRGTQGAFRGQAAGSQKKRGLFMLEGRNRRVAVVESAIDAISYRVLYPNDWVVATGGVTSRHPMLDSFQARGFQLIAAHDRDRAGSQAAVRMAENYPGTIRLAPPRERKDWNEVLTHQSDEEEEPFPTPALCR